MPKKFRGSQKHLLDLLDSKDYPIALNRLMADLSAHTIHKKVAIIVEHFNDKVAGKINGQAKAMIVTRSRLHAVRYKQAVDKTDEKRC